MLPDDLYLDHIAIAVSDLDSRIKVYEDLGFKFSSEREVVESQKVVTAFAHVDKNAHLELLMPVNKEGPIQKFIEKNGEGIHHLCFSVEDVGAKSEELLSKGYKLIYDSPQAGANNCLINFIHPKSTGGVLIEISQKQSK
jgi:methylmalonyl-CoA/ethylmalonyl-CoA epimerase